MKRNRNSWAVLGYVCILLACILLFVQTRHGAVTLSQAKDDIILVFAGFILIGILGRRRKRSERPPSNRRPRPSSGRTNGFSTHATDSKAAGIEGEQATAHELKFLGHEYKVFNRVFIHVKGQNLTQEFDHVVIGPNALFHIDTKHWGGEVRFTKDGVIHKGQADKDPTNQMYRHETVLKELLREHGIQADIVGILNFSNPGAQLVGESPAFRTVKLDRLIHTIKEYPSSRRRLSAAKIEEIAGLIQANSRKHSFND